MNSERTVCIITGGTRGIGAATAERLASSAAGLLVSYISKDEAAAALVDRLTAAGNEVRALKADVSSEADVLAMFDVADALGRLTTLVNNAGILFPIGRLVDFDLHRIERTLAVNVTGTILCCREAVKRMSTATGGQGGAIVNVSSRAAALGSPNEFMDYAASKGAVDTLTVRLANEVAREGIRVNAVRPGLIDTDIHSDAGFPDRVFALSDKIPMGRHGTADEVAASIAWLASPEASFVTGAVLDVGGGR